MKRLFIISLLFVASSFATSLSAQQVVKKRIGSFVENGNVVVAEANTTLAVDLTVEVEHYVAGPYARYAERMLGCKTPRLTDNTSYRIVSTNVGVVEDNSHLSAGNLENVSYCGSAKPEGFSEFMPDRLSSKKQDLESCAAAAAEQIFTLRTARLELITAELGDGVYGAGLESALNEISRLEKEYSELFLGKRSVSTITYRYYIPVEPAKYEESEAEPAAEGVEPVVVEPKMLPQSHIVARFGEHVGVVAGDDLKGDIILLTINPVEMSYPESNIKGKVTYRYANNSEVTLSLGQDILAKATLPVYEFGRTVTFVAPAK